ncbi:MAG: response regulator [Thermoflexales bacterium]|nr:response regulator [Thermoflexales bacterium]
MSEETPNILVVDDTEAICSALRDLLTMNGYAVRTAPSGERALQIMENAEMDLIITDLKMGGMSGLDLLKHVKQIKPSLPVVILTGFGDMDSVIAAMRAGVADYLKKPFSVNEVLEVVRRELRKASFVVPAVMHVTPSELAPDTGEKPPRLYLFSPGDLARIERLLSELRAQVTAESVLLLEEAGYVISAKGTFNHAELPTLTALITGGRSTTAKLARMLGEEQPFALNYLEGQSLSVYTAGLGKGLFLVLMVPKYVKQGAVWLYARKVTGEIESMAEHALQEVTSSKGTGPLGPSRAELREELSGQTENVFGQELQEEEAPPAPVHTLTFEQAMSQGLMGNMVEMMAREPLEAEPAVAAGPMPEEQPAGPVETMSFEEAMQRGLLGGLGQDEPEAAPQPTEPSPTEPVETMSFEEAMQRGLLGGPVDVAPERVTPQPEPPAPREKPATETEFLTFEEMLDRGLLESGGGQLL